MEYNYYEIVNKLTGKLFLADRNFVEEYGIGFAYRTDGNIDIIEFGGIEIFNSESYQLDEIYIEEKDEYLSEEDFITYLIHKTQTTLVDALNALESASLYEGDI